jgi:hypothetical protein
VTIDWKVLNYEILYQYSNFLFLKSSQIVKALFLEGDDYEKYEYGKPSYALP